MRCRARPDHWQIRLHAFMNTLEDAGLTVLIGQLKQRKLIAIENGNVSYKPPASQS